ncbi:MAG: class I SAM-dependent methyltransferase [Anaerolineales bacterium]
MAESEDRPPVCDYEGSDYQQAFWDSGGREYEDRVEAVAIDRMLPPGRGRLLEVGAGAGRNSPRYRGYEQVVLLDYSRTQLAQARERLGSGGRYLYVAGDAYSLPFAPAVFGAATMIRTLHHMAAPEQALAQARGVLEGGAPFLLEFANKRNLKAILRWLLRHQAWSPFSPEPVEFVELNYDFHPRSVERWLQVAGFRVADRRTVSHFRWRPLKRAVPLDWLVALDAAAQPTGRWWQLTPSVFLLATAVGRPQAPAAGEFWRCPRCGSLQLEEEVDALRCQGCGRLWVQRQGIYDFKAPAEQGSSRGRR